MFAVSPSGIIQARGVRSLHNIEYSRVKGLPLYLDASLPDSDEPTDAVIIVHGGGWVRGDRRTDVQPLFAPLSEAGIAWFSIDYRLAKNVTQFGVAVGSAVVAARGLNVGQDGVALLFKGLDFSGECELPCP